MYYAYTYVTHMNILGNPEIASILAVSLRIANSKKIKYPALHRSYSYKLGLLHHFDPNTSYILTSTARWFTLK